MILIFSYWHELVNAKVHFFYELMMFACMILHGVMRRYRPDSIVRRKYVLLYSMDVFIASGVRLKKLSIRCNALNYGCFSTLAV